MNEADRQMFAEASALNQALGIAVLQLMRAYDEGRLDIQRVEETGKIIRQLAGTFEQRAAELRDAERAIDADRGDVEQPIQPIQPIVLSPVSQPATGQAPTT